MSALPAPGFDTAAAELRLIEKAAYDCTSDLRPRERVALAELVQEIAGTRPWPRKIPESLERLIRPIEDALTVASSPRRLRTAVLRAMAREIQVRGRAIWGWTHDQWVETLGTTEVACRIRHRGQTDKRQQLMAVAYLLGDFTDWGAIGEVNRLGLARKVFGHQRVDAVAEQVLGAAIRLGYCRKVHDRLQVALCEALLENHSPRLEDLTPERFDALRRERSPSDLRGWFVLGQALFGLGLFPEAPRTLQRGTAWHGASYEDKVAGEWLNWCTRWRSTSALSPRTRRSYHRTLFLAGRWLAEAHPEVCSPEHWTRSLAAEYVAALDRTTVGQWGNTFALDPATVGKPIAARTKECRLTAVRVFFRDLQE